MPEFWYRDKTKNCKKFLTKALKNCDPIKALRMDSRGKCSLKALTRMEKMKLVPPKKVRIFSYNTIGSALLLETKGLEITFNQEFITMEMLFELESILAWCTSHTEVKSVLLQTKFNHFLNGFDYEEIKKYDIDKINKLYEKLNKINQALIFLPQTIIVNLKQGAMNEGLTMALHADVRVADNNAKFKFSQMENGLMDHSGLLSNILNKSSHMGLRALVLSGLEFNFTELNSTGSLTFDESKLEEILKNTNAQSSLARSQTKCALLGLEEISKKNNEFVEKLFNTLLLCNDYKREKEFINLRELKSQIQEEVNSNLSQ